MSKVIRFGLLATAAVVLLAWASPAAAKCGSGKNIGNYPSAGACGYYCQMQDPGAGMSTIKGRYWVLGLGNDDVHADCNAAGLGTDSGNYQADGTCGQQGWLAGSTLPNTFNVGIGTDAGNTDGCPLAGANIAVMFSDTNAANNQAFFGINIAQMNAAAVADMGLAGSLVLKPLGAPHVAYVSKAGTTVTVNLDWTATVGPASQFCIAPGGDSTSCAQAIQGWDIYKREDSKLAPVGDNSRARTSWTLLQSVGNVTAASVAFACTTTTNNVARLALVPRLDSGFKPDYVGVGTARIECDPTIADPSGKFKIIDKKAPVQPKK
jgi:hypothetical protein